MPSICLISALPAEARPLIAYYGLRSLAHDHLRLYQGDIGYLLQCGVGKLNAATATAAMLQTLPEVDAIINVGIAGSEHPIGQNVVAHAVQDEASAQQWFPNLPAQKRIADTKSVKGLTVDKPVTRYTPDIAFDMEASGIFNAASKIMDTAFVHSVKVVSDNSSSDVNTISAKTVAALLPETIPVIEQLRQALPFAAQPDNSATNAMAAMLTERLHYTATEQHALKQLLHRYNALYSELPDEQLLIEQHSAKAIRHWLNEKIDQASVNY